MESSLGKSIKIGIYAAEPYPGGEVNYIKALIKSLLLLKNNTLELFVTKDSFDYFADVPEIVSRKYIYNFNLRFGMTSINKLKRRLIKIFLFLKSDYQLNKTDYADLDVMILPYFAIESLTMNMPCIVIPHDKRHFVSTKRFKSFDRKTTRIRLEKAKVIVVESNFVKNDILSHTPQVSHKIKILISPPPINDIINSEIDLSAIKKKYNLPSNFLIYPAHIIPDKNHVNLIFAIRRIEEKYNEVINLVCTYMNYNSLLYDEIKELVINFSLNKKISFLEKIPYDSLQNIYRLSRALVMPTMLESVSLPIWEAFYLGVPVVSSNVCALPEQVGDAGLLFDPTNVEDMADKIYKIWSDEALRKELVKKGYERIKDLTFENYAKQWQQVINEALK